MNRPEKYIEIIRPGWSAPAAVRAFTTTRIGGVSKPPFATLNLADHVDDQHEAVIANRELLRRQFSLPAEPVWLTQVHGDRIVDASAVETPTAADGSFAERSNVICAVLTADCLPLFLCSRDATRVALLHVGWRGLARGVIDAGIEALNQRPDGLIAWLGPAIGAAAYEIGEDVRVALINADPSLESCFERSPRAGHWFADLYRLVEAALLRSGVTDCTYDKTLCTYRNKELFFSYRREPRCGRMASVIWIEG